MVRVDGDHARVVRARRAGRRRPVLGQARAPRRASPTAACARTATTAASAAGSRTRARCRAWRASADPLAITDFLYGQGDLLRGGAASRPPEIAPGQSLTFLNRDAARTIFHTITACKAPCNRTTGIAYPLADGPVDFDSGELGFGPQGFTAAANRDTWSTPTDLGPGTYTYFCRVHPFMRGAFRVKG